MSSDCDCESLRAELAETRAALATAQEKFCKRTDELQEQWVLTNEANARAQSAREEALLEVRSMLLANASTYKTWTFAELSDALHAIQARTVPEREESAPNDAKIPEREGVEVEKIYLAVCRARWCRKYFYEGPDKPPVLCPECSESLDVMSRAAPLKGDEE